MARPKKTDTPARDKILRAASDLFFKQGYHQTGTNQLIGEAGVSKASFYTHFPSKEDLAVAYVCDSAANSLGMIRSALGKLEDPLKRYLMLHAAIEQHLCSTDFRGCHFSNIAREFPDIDSPVRAEVITFELDYRNLIQQTVEALHADAPERFAKTGLSIEEVSDRYYLLLEGAITASTNFHDVWPFKSAAPAIRALVDA